MSNRPLLVVGNKNYSSWSLRPWLLFAQGGIDFDEKVIPLETPEFAAEIERWSPSRRVPALVHGDVHVWDSLAICEYANETFLDGRGWPSDRAARAEARAIVAEMHSGFVALRSECPMNIRRVLDAPLAISDAAKRDVARVSAIWRGARERHGARGPFLFGEFSIADAFYAPVLFRVRSYGLPVGDVERRWMDAMLALPSLQRWIADGAAEPWRIESSERVGTAG